MPGHVKLGKAGEPDPDPCPYLVLTPEMKREDANKPYDQRNLTDALMESMATWNAYWKALIVARLLLCVAMR